MSQSDAKVCRDLAECFESWGDSLRKHAAASQRAIDGLGSIPSTDDHEQAFDKVAELLPQLRQTWGRGAQIADALAAIFSDIADSEAEKGYDE